MTDFSSWGPTDDGRVKADVVGNGYGVYSSTTGSNSSYDSYNGTSMAAPNVTGTLALVYELLQDEFSWTPLSSSMKGLTIHSAFDAGNVGPDYVYGWGVVDAAAMVSTPWTIWEPSYTGTEQILEVYSDGSSPLKATIVWTDLPGTPQSGVDDPTSVLVNDLDLWVTDASGKVFYPWTLDPANPSAPAVQTKANHIDNVEQVLINVPTAGNYTIHIGHTGSTFTQNYSLIVSGVEVDPEPEPINGTPGNDTLDGTAGDDVINGLDGNDQLKGKAGNDTLDGGNGADKLFGEGGNDSLLGGAGNDQLNGGLGADTMQGGKENDTYTVNSLTDVVIENAAEGTDLIKSNQNYTLGNNQEQLTLIGTADRTGKGNSLSNIINGNTGNNSLQGLNGNDQLFGQAGNDTLSGGGGSDQLVGGAGNDQLTGNAGADWFILNSVSEKVDTITDFKASESDQIRIDASSFGGGLPEGQTLPSGRFVLGTTAGDLNDRFIYNKTNGSLFFDVDGTGATAQAQIATLTGAPDLAASNIYLF